MPMAGAPRMTMLADAVGHLQVAAVGDELFLSGQQALVEHDHGAVLPFYDRMH